MSKQLSQIDYEHINLIVQSAEEKGIKYQVCQCVQEFLVFEPNMNLVEAYERSFKLCSEDFSNDSII